MLCNGGAAVWIVRFFFSGVCHQIPERCLYLQGQPLPLCARCSGTFLGAAAGLVVLALLGQGRRSHLPRWPVAIVLAILCGGWALDGLNSTVALYIGRAWLYEPSNLLRLMTGAGLGVSIAVLLYPIYQQTFWPSYDDRPVLDRPWLLGPVLGGVGAIVALLWFWHDAPYWLWVLVLTVSAMSVFATLNGVLIALLARKEAATLHWYQRAGFLAAGLLATAAETGALALLRALIL